MSDETVGYIRSQYRSMSWQKKRDANTRQRKVLAERDALRALIVKSRNASFDSRLVRASEIDVTVFEALDRKIKRSSWKARLAEIKRVQGERNVENFSTRITRVHCVYLIANTWIDAVKIGVTSPHQRRLQTWIDAHWMLIDTWPVTDDRQGREIERQIIRYWRIQCRSGYGGNEIDYPNKGMTESAQHSQVSLSNTVALIDRIHGEISRG